ncbi:hypothetical protein GXW82_31350 [Streptacidiphilus sp. 4-A2]|nr:hypothetical protein [Streptacidiphilus sp. 4-A2]
MSGCLINTVLIRFRPLPGSLDECLRDTAAEIAHALGSQEDLPFTSVVAQLRRDDRALPREMPQVYLSLDDEYTVELEGLECRGFPWCAGPRQVRGDPRPAQLAR